MTAFAPKNQGSRAAAAVIPCTLDGATVAMLLDQAADAGVTLQFYASAVLAAAIQESNTTQHEGNKG